MSFAIRAVDPAATRPLRQRVLRPHESLEELASHEPPGVHAIAAFIDTGELVAAGFVCPDGGPGAWRVRGMATDPQHRGQGAGAQILDRLVEHAIQQGATRVWCNARTPALGLYERAGFEPESEEFEIPGIGPHFVMALRV
ncbi:MAG TPA: GNAT family N-acetyltransferase [Solirubrobacteraceae bacterium]|nr:GNAT family N-acetyltransferase [Solirubrobacteraceae bacterium]